MSRRAGYHVTQIELSCGHLTAVELGPEAWRRKLPRTPRGRMTAYCPECRTWVPVSKLVRLA